MTKRIVLEIPGRVRRALWAHLLPQRDPIEEVAFLFARQETSSDEERLRTVDWHPVPPEGFESRSAFHLDLGDHARAAAIKRAHDLGASIVEFHSHTGTWPAAFSPSDLAGFREFVPHVWWRLKSRPYAAVVVTKTGFDALAWIEGPDLPLRLTALESGGSILRPTALTPLIKKHDEL